LSSGRVILFAIAVILFLVAVVLFLGALGALLRLRTGSLTGDAARRSGKTPSASVSGFHLQQ